LPRVSGPTFAGGSVQRNAARNCTLLYEHSSAFHMGNCQAFYAQGISRLKGKVAVFGFGIVVHKEEVKFPGPNNGTQTNLHVTLRHHDYQNLVRQNVLLISIIGVADFFFVLTFLSDLLVKGNGIV
jgi:hypothetical protein